MKFISLLVLLLLFGCQSGTQFTEKRFPAPEMPLAVSRAADWPPELTKERYYDKVLGLLVGSAIGDAMGAPVEMWGRKTMDIWYGYIDTLVNVIREGSPEGPWEDNLPAGSTTDDTRWKYLTGYFLLSQMERDSLDPVDFAAYIVDIYESEQKQVREVEQFSPEYIERELMHMTWLQEFAKVAKPFADDNLQGYSYALNRFYGGEMACPGMLYSPMIGAVYPGQAEKAYAEAYRLGFFDIGYARDISALTSAYVSKAMQPGVSYEEISEVTREVDPLRYFNSRLIGRLAHGSYIRAREIGYEVDGMGEKDIDPNLRLPKNFKGSRLEYARLLKAYEMMDGQLQHIPFHAGEIHLINLVALEFSKGDFRKAMEFITNYGRDNDTVAAVTGAILGAYLGYEKLPKGMAEVVLQTSSTVIKLDLEELARQMTEAAFANSSDN